nr:hypothetical protein [Iodidimonas gelatinilytica]
MAVVLTTAPAPGTLAQTDPAQNPSGGRDAIEEITVTGQKRGPQRVRDVPAAIQAIGGNTIDDMLATEFSDLAGMIPSCNFRISAPATRNISSAASTVRAPQPLAFIMMKRSSPRVTNRMAAAGKQISNCMIWPASKC